MSRVSSRRKKTESVTAELMPLIDMVFILLIFFMISSQFLKPAINLNLPVAGSGQQVSDKKVLIISVTKDGVLYLNQEKIEKSLLVNAIKKRLNQNTMVVISADKAVSYGTFVEIMDSLKANGISNVALEYEQ